MTNENCKCGRRARYSYSVRGRSQATEDQVYVCGYHTWWHGSQIDEEYRANLCNTHRITQ